MFYCNICGGLYLSREQDLIEKPLPKIENHIAVLSVLARTGQTESDFILVYCITLARVHVLYL